MSKFRLTSAHPVQARFEELCAKAYELGLKLNFYGGTLQMIDVLSGQAFDVLDIEGDNITVCDFPPLTEVKIVYDKSPVQVE